MIIDVHVDYAADDSCQIQLWAKGHHPDYPFIKACEDELLAFDERIVSLKDAPVRQSYWRTVKADTETKAHGVCDYVHVESAPGRGAYPVTILDMWLPLFTENKK